MRTSRTTGTQSECRSRRWTAFLAIAAAVVISGMTKITAAKSLPKVRGSIEVTADSYPFGAADHSRVPTDLGKVGYVKEEFFASGMANVYDWPEGGGPAVVRTPNAPYTTRVLVRRPISQAKFSGNVIVERLNPTNLFDLNIGWAISHDHIKAEGYGEDCLCLNVWTPEPNSNHKRTVMFWCHGGAWSGESGSWPWINGESLSRRGDVVVVTINHRINVFVFCHLEDVGGEKYAASGLVGMLDLVAGLQWVHDNIARFGGDPGNVMIFGESGGGLKTSTLLAMPQAKGLSHRAAIQSGALLRSNTRERANESTKALLAERKFGQGKAPVYMYLFAWRSPALGGKLGAPHTVEIPFVWDSTDIPKVMTTGSPEEKALAAKTSEAWIQFARTGNPNHKGLPNWPAYTPKDRATMVFDNICRMVNDPGSEERRFWQSL